MATPTPNDTPTLKPVKEPGPVATAILVRARFEVIARKRAGRSKVRPDSWVSCATTVPSGRISASAERADDVSMAKINAEGL